MMLERTCAPPSAEEAMTAAAVSSQEVSMARTWRVFIEAFLRGQELLREVWCSFVVYASLAYMMRNINDSL
jgi:hypothetical protein